MESSNFIETTVAGFQQFEIEAMLIYFYDNNDVIRKEFVSQGRTVTDEYYLNVIER